MNVGDTLVDVAAAYRLTRLITDDVILQPVRAEVILTAYLGPRPTGVWRRRGRKPRTPDGPGYDDLMAMTDADLDALPEADDDAPKLADFIRCRWCVGLWIAGVTVAARRYAPRAWNPVARVLAVGAAATLLGGLER